MSFYEAFERALIIKDMTVADVCAKTGMHHSYFSKLKSGHTKDVTWEKALLIIKALGMTPNGFYELTKSDRDGD